MSKQQTNQETTNMGPSDAPQVSEHCENPLPEASAAEGDGPIKVEPVDPVKRGEGESSSNSGMEVDEEEAKKDKKQALHTCGSQRKRFKWFISQGYEYEDASDLAKDPQKYRELRAAAEGRSLEVCEREVQLAQQRKALNRFAKRKYTQLREHGYSEEEAIALAPTLVDDPGSRQKHLKSDESKKPGDPVKMVITQTDYPRTVLTEDQAKLVKDAILKLVIDNPSAKSKPHFAGCKFIKGYLVFDCLDQQTITWIQYRARELQLWENCTLKAISEKFLRNSDIFTVKLPDSEQESDDEIRTFFDKQNNGIDSSKWIFAERKLTDDSSKTLELTLKTDPVSVKKLHELNYTLNYKFYQVKLTRITIDLLDPAESPTTTKTPSGSNRRPRPSGNRSRGGTGQMRQHNFTGDYIDGLLDQLNRSLYAPQQQQYPQQQSQNMSYFGFGGCVGGGSPYRRGTGRGGGRGGGGGGGFRNNNPRQRYF